MLLTLLVTVTFAASALAHGYIKWIGIDNTVYPGWNPHIDDALGAKRISFKFYTSPHPRYAVVDVLSPDIACGVKSKPPALRAQARTGSNITFGWSTWPLTHNGPIMTYMARYDTADVADAKVNDLNWFKIAELGLLPDRKTWATNILTANKNITTVTIPHDLRPGNYIVRHEIITLHAATEDTSSPPPPGTKVGAQHFVSCMNVEVLGNGSATPTDVVKFPGAYHPREPSLYFDVYRNIYPYPIPGPKLYVPDPRTEAAVLEPRPYKFIPPMGNLLGDLQWFAEYQMQAIEFDGYTINVNKNRTTDGPNPKLSGPPPGSVPPGSKVWKDEN